MWIWVILIVSALGAGYLRLAPSDPAVWHVPVEGDADRDFAGGALRIVQGDLARFDQVAKARGAKLLAGSLEEGRITYISRTKIWGFPDYITAEQRGDALAVYGRLRFGRSDLGVNRRRIEGWLARL